MALKLDDFATLDTAMLEVLKPGGTDRLGLSIELAGPSHPKAVAWQNETAKRNMRIASQKEQAQANGRKWKGDDETPDEQRDRNVAWIVTHIISWEPAIEYQGVEHKFSPEIAAAILKDRRFGFIFEQCVDFLVDARSFTKRSAGILPDSQSDTSA